jgi:hypothetical protein
MFNSQYLLFANDFKIYCSINHAYDQGCFCDGTRWNPVLEVLSQKDATQNGVPEPSLPGIGIN